MLPTTRRWADFNATYVDYEILVSRIFFFIVATSATSSETSIIRSKISLEFTFATFVMKNFEGWNSCWSIGKGENRF